jgi:inhibitor of KinA sporulation pathway (predicted exonuclease)
MKRIYLDTEYCYPGMRRGLPRPTAADKRQIVQISAIIFDTESGQEVGSFDQLVTPTFEKRVQKFFTELTDISQADIERSGVSFEAAMVRFAKFCCDSPIWTFDKDEEVLRQNCGYTDIKWPFRSPFIRVKPLLPGWGVDPNAYSSGTLYQAAGLEINGHVHNALHDVRSMANAIFVFERR